MRLALLLLVAGCVSRHPVPTEPCAREQRACPLCFDGVTTCRWNGFATTRNTCGGCGGPDALVGELCAQEVTPPEGEEMTCRTWPR